MTTPSRRFRAWVRAFQFTDERGVQRRGVGALALCLHVTKRRVYSWTSAISPSPPSRQMVQQLIRLAALRGTQLSYEDICGRPAEEISGQSARANGTAGEQPAPAEADPTQATATESIRTTPAARAEKEGKACSAKP